MGLTSLWGSYKGTDGEEIKAIQFSEGKENTLAVAIEVSHLKMDSETGALSVKDIQGDWTEIEYGDWIVYNEKTNEFNVFRDADFHLEPKTETETEPEWKDGRTADITKETKRLHESLEQFENELATSEDEAISQIMTPGNGNYIKDPDTLKVTGEEVKEFISSLTVSKAGEKTTVVTATLINGFEITKTSSCLDVRSYDEEIGLELCRKEIEDEVWYLLAFLKQNKKYVDKINEVSSPATTPIEEIYEVQLEKMSYVEALTDLIGNFGADEGIYIRLPEWDIETAVYSTLLPGLTSPILVINSEKGVVPWNPTYIEMYAQNWQIVSLKEKYCGKKEI